MPGDPSPKGSSGGIIAYNHDSARGWNDPPTFAFSNNKTGNRPKLDLRKRVSHQQALHGVQAASPSLQTTNASIRDDVINGVAGMTLNGVRQPVYTPPPVTTASVGSNILSPHIPVTFTRSVSTPSFSSETVTNTAETATYPLHTTPSGAVHTKSTENLPGNLGHPLFDLKDHSFEPVRTAHLHSIRSTAEIGDHLDDHHDNHASPQIFHPITTPVTTAPSVPSYQATPPVIPPLGPDNHASPRIFHPVNPPVTTAASVPSYQAPPLAPDNHASPQIFHPITPPVTTAASVPSYQATPPVVPPLGPDNHASPRIFHPITPPVTTAASVTSYQATPPAVPPAGHATPPPPLAYQSPVGHVTPPMYPVRGQSPIPPTIPMQGGGVANQLPPHSMTPPPPPGNHASPAGSLSAGNTPRSTSPSGQGKNGDSVSTMDDKEGLKLTMDALQDVMSKLHATLEKRVADDISRRLQVMSQSWTNGKLSQGVKCRMIKLAKALDDGNVEEAHHIHVSLMVDFVAEVNQWMVAVKKLINLVRSSNAFPTHS